MEEIEELEPEDIEEPGEAPPVVSGGNVSLLIYDKTGKIIRALRLPENMVSLNVKEGDLYITTPERRTCEDSTIDVETKTAVSIEVSES